MKRIFLSLLLVGLSFQTIQAQENLTYQLPDAAILNLADAPLPPSVVADNKGENAFFFYRSRYKSIAELSETEMRLGGLRINPKTNINSRQAYSEKITFFDLKSGKEREIVGLPTNGRFANALWNRAQTKMAFTNTTENGVELWVVDTKTAQAKQLTKDHLNANLGRPFTWMGDGETLLINVLPSDKKALIDAKEAVPTGPTVSMSDGKEAQNRTYQDLLQNTNDEFNFEQLTRSELHLVKLDGTSTKWKNAGMYTNTNVSPDGKYVAVSEMKKPFSYIVPFNRFPKTTIVYDQTGKEVKLVADSPLEEDRPKGFMSTSKGVRNISWRADKPATLVWAEALDEGNAEIQVDYRDAIYELSAPFTAEKNLLLKTIDRFAGITWGDDNTAIAYDRWWNSRNASNYIFNPSDNAQEPKRFFSRNYQDSYNDPGSFVTVDNQYGRQQLYMENGKLMLEGDGISADGILPFIDEFDVKTMQTKRIWRAAKSDKLETLVNVLDPKKGIVLERIESKTDYPNLYVRNILKPKQKPQQVTFHKNPFEAMNGVSKEVISYKREDGIELSGTLYLPPNYDKKKKEKLPMLMWAYPREFKDPATAGQITTSPNEFIYPSYGSPIFWALRGFAVLDDAAFPIIGEGDEQPNDTFVKQLVGSAKAGIDAVDKLGYIDRTRVGVGGHSYGAFMTANLLTHSDLFAAGIARSGAYNRTLTPFGFQQEERNYWEAPEVYNTMSPFQKADKMKTPILLIHGEADNNSGTFPMQSERYFNALKGLGATARYVVLPKESHGYSARESVLHMLWEQDQWLEKHVKNKGKETQTKK